MRRTPPEVVTATVEVEVRYAETDQMGVVHHANYLVWFELARTRLCAESGFHYSEIERLGYLLMVSGATLRYRAGARYGDRVGVTAWVERMGSRGLAFGYAVRRGEELLATGTTEHIWVEAATRRPAVTPAPLREPFRRLAGRGAPPC